MTIPGWTWLKARWAAVAPKWRAVLALVMVFAAGLAGGDLVSDIADDFDRPFAEADDDDDDDEDGRNASEETILANLGLTSEQRAGIERAFESREERLTAYWDSQLPTLETIIDSSREEIRVLLTPNQRATYDSQLARLRMIPRQALHGDQHDEDYDD